jgi:hypothetical protein
VVEEAQALAQSRSLETLEGFPRMSARRRGRVRSASGRRSSDFGGSTRATGGRTARWQKGLGPLALGSPHRRLAARRDAAGDGPVEDLKRTERLSERRRGVVSSDSRDRPASTIAFSLGPGPIPADATRLSFLRATLAAAFDRGIRHVDLHESVSPDAALAVTRLAAGDRWSSLTLFVSERPHPTSADSPADGPALVRLRPAGEDPDASPRGPRSEEGVRFPDLESAERFASLEARGGARWISFPGSLIDSRRVGGLVGSVLTEGGRVLLTNPHSDGRLGGPGEGLASPAPTRAPTPLASIERAYAPVLRLGFLTEGGRRTLPQAAVGFVLAVGAIPAVRFSDVRQLTAFGDPTMFAPLAPEELARILGPP